MKTVNNYTETDLGNVSPNPRGEYDNSEAYEYLDLVSLGGGSYLCLAELGQKITGIAPVQGETTEHWQCVAVPGNLTEEYKNIYSDVKRLARETKEDAEKSETAKTGAETAQRESEEAANASIKAAQESENSKDSAAGYEKTAANAASAALGAEGNVRKLVEGFDTHVQEKTEEAEQAITTAKDNAVGEVERQEKASVQEVKDQTASYITEQKNLAKQEIDDKIQTFDVDVNAIKQQVANEGTKQVQAVQDAQTKATEAVETAKTNAVQTVENEGTTQVGKVTEEGTKQLEILQAETAQFTEDREQIQTNKTDIADLRQTKAGAIVESANGETIVVRDSSDNFFEDFRVLGKSEQGGNPSPDNKQDITNIGKNGSVGIKVRGKNLIQYPYVQSDKYDPMYNAKAGSVINIDGITITVLEDRGLKIVGTATTDTYINVMRDKVLVNKNDVKYSKDLSHDINNGLIFYLVKKDETINKIVYPQAEIGETVTEYEPWKGEQILTVTTPNGLPGLKTQSGGNYTDSTGKQWICDEISVRDGVFGILKNLNMVHVKNCEESFAIGEHANGQKYVGFNASNAEANYVPMSDRYIGSEWTNTNNKIYVPEKGRAIITDNRFTDLETVKTIIRQENPCILYKVNTPVFEPFSEEVQQAYRALHTYYPNTTVTNDAGAHMEVEYVADTKTYIDKKLQEIVTAHTQGIANLLSLMPLETQATMIENDTNNILENVEEMKHE